MQSEKSLTGHIALSANTIVKSVAYFFACVLIISLSAILKFILIDKVKTDSLPLTILFIVLSVTFIMTALFVYMIFSRRELVANQKTLFAVASGVVFAYIVNIYMSLISVFLMPIMLTAFIITPIAKNRDAFTANIFCCLLVLFTMLLQSQIAHNVNVNDIITMFIIGVSAGTVVSYKVSNNSSRSSYILNGFIIATFSFGIGLLFSYISSETKQIFQNNILFLLGGIYSPILFGLVTQPIFERVFNLITDGRLVELTDHNSPLIKRLRIETPGTFNHCLAVANFAETCASAIGENPYLARACAYYHDVGKLMNSQYFKENQSEINPHDELLPEVSADIIRAHTTDGLKICNEYRIPYEVSHVTIQHHGTLLIPVFYNKAQQLTDGEVNPYQYSYHGVCPVTKVAAIIMLCDVSEAAIRAMDTPDGEKVDKLLTNLINTRISAGQFINCDISLRDLNTIKETIISAYGGLFHKRMQYPGGDKK